MPEAQTMKRARRDKAQGKAPSTQASEFVREEIEHVRAGKHGARSAKQAIAIGLSKARRAGVDLPPPKPGTTSQETRRSAARDAERGRSATGSRHTPSASRSRAATSALKREGQAAASPKALGQNARAAAARKSAGQRSASARQAARTKGPAQRKSAAKKAARTRRRSAG